MSQFASQSQSTVGASNSEPSPARSSTDKPELVVFNSLTRRAETFTSLEPNRVRMYTCGLTVNDLMHLGHARAYVMWDVLKRYLEYLGYEVLHVSNITDISVDDKILQRVRGSGESFQQHINRYTQSYLEDRLKLGIAPAHTHPLATQHIQEMIELIERLIEKGFAYQTEDGVYFRISKFHNYGKLSGVAKDKLEAGSSGRVKADEYRKEEVGDFTLWKRMRPGEPYWHSPWGPGRPGWHVECSAMAMKYLGESFDIHCGGEEHKFPHHDNEIAQSEATTGKPLARYWLHVRHLLLDGSKMSKSTREFISVRDAVDQYGALPVRIFLLSTHYRKTMNFDEHAFHTASEHADRLSALWAAILHFSTQGQAIPHGAEEKLLLELRHSRAAFEGAMSKDLDTPLALSAILKLAGETSAYLKAHGSISRNAASAILEFLKSAGSVLFGDLVESELQEKKDEVFRGLVNVVLQRREELRAHGEYDKADRVRERLEQLGIVLEDLSNSTIWRRMHLGREKPHH